MKVKELIAKLQKFNQEKEIWILNDNLPIASRLDVRVVNNSDCVYCGVKKGSICIY